MSPDTENDTETTDEDEPTEDLPATKLGPDEHPGHSEAAGQPAEV